MAVTEWLPLMQFVSSTALTVMSLTVAVGAAVIGYRNGSGWMPILVVKNMTMGELKTPGLFMATSFEVWNRRKYPIVVRKMRVSFDGLKKLTRKMKEEVPEDELEWGVWGGEFAELRGEFLVAPNEHKAFFLMVQFEPPDMPYESFGGTTARVRALLFDPKKNKHFIVRHARSKYGGPDLE